MRGRLSGVILNKSSKKLRSSPGRSGCHSLIDETKLSLRKKILVQPIIRRKNEIIYLLSLDSNLTAASFSLGWRKNIDGCGKREKERKFAKLT